MFLPSYPKTAATAMVVDYLEESKMPTLTARRYGSIDLRTQRPNAVVTVITHGGHEFMINVPDSDVRVESVRLGDFRLVTECARWHATGDGRFIDPGQTLIEVGRCFWVTFDDGDVTEVMHSGRVKCVKVSGEVVLGEE